MGEALARARQAQGLAIADVAQQLKFMPRQIEALEQERFTSLPGATIARGMVRNYAKLLKLDPGPLLQNLAERMDAPDAGTLAARFSQPVPFSDNGRRSTVVYLAVSACVLAIAGGMVYEWRHERGVPEFVAAASVPERASDVAPRPVPAQTASAASMHADTESPAATPTSVRAPNATPAPVPLPKSSTAAPSLPVAAASPGEPKSIGSHRIVLSFNEEAWLEITDGAGRLLTSSLNAAGTERVVQGRPPFNLVIGNAGHVKVRYNDQSVDLQPHVKVEVARFTLK